MLIAIYSALLTLVTVVGSPFWLVRMALNRRYRAGFAGRFGGSAGQIAVKLRTKRVIWVHAVSVGEVLAAERLIRELGEALPGVEIAISTTTETGQKLARQRFAGKTVFYFPLDFGFSVRRYLRALRPELVVLMESELWPRMLVECERAGVPVAVVNARVSDRSFLRSMRLRLLWRPAMAKVRIFLAQGEESAERLRQIGVPAARVRVTGNLKFDAPEPSETEAGAAIRAWVSDGTELVVCGSTLEGEEAMLLAALPEVKRLRPKARLLLAPRHPQRFDEVVRLVEERGFEAVRVSELVEANGEVGSIGVGSTGVRRERQIPIGNDKEPEDVLVLNSLGSLAAMYGLAAVAFVGGSLVPKGGHNLLEPARFGVPVLTGESFENFREMGEAMRAAKAVRFVPVSRLAEAITAMLFDGKAMGERGRAFFLSQAGATERTVAELLKLVEEGRR